MMKNCPTLTLQFLYALLTACWRTGTGAHSLMEVDTDSSEESDEGIDAETFDSGSEADAMETEAQQPLDEESCEESDQS